MAEINGYLLTADEEKACEELIRKMRKKPIYGIDFTGYLRVKAKNKEEAISIFWDWVGDIQDKSLADYEVIVQSPYFDFEGTEKEE